MSLYFYSKLALTGFYILKDSMWSRVLHFAADAVLVSVILASVKRSTGITPAVSKIKHKGLRSYVEQYLNMGEYILDASILYLSHSSYFERRR
ncbi:uncharacterized protein BX664DRAFT_341442 [Halteromyces radiatus]|uniref:uncharacterized protein n=1 Tax=Halteromyces radiatus TaxID=101107 RepID=UPI0022211BA6|nr:uncharacterized protein BX664DRAFT_341442 [Halteromyces radiatus]KAI8079782.1 hypothetical protein BX664DRAFT_341442 [Halteromyces radiatus]